MRDSKKSNPGINRIKVMCVRTFCAKTIPQIFAEVLTTNHSVGVPPPHAYI